MLCVAQDDIHPFTLPSCRQIILFTSFPMLWFQFFHNTSSEPIRLGFLLAISLSYFLTVKSPLRRQSHGRCWFPKPYPRLSKAWAYIVCHVINASRPAGRSACEIFIPKWYYLGCWTTFSTLIFLLWELELNNNEIRGIEWWDSNLRYCSLG
jgi:hypothetical protein